MIRVAPPAIADLVAFATASGGQAEDVELGDALLSEPLACIEAPERLALAKLVLKALHQVRDGQDPQKIASQFQKKDAKIILTAFSRIVMALIRAQAEQRAVLGFDGPYPDPNWFVQVLDRVNDSRLQAQANITVNLPLAMSVLLAAWGFVWTRVQA